MLSEEDKAIFGGIGFLPFINSIGFTLVTINYSSKDKKLKQYLARISGYDEAWGRKKDFIKAYYQSLNDEFDRLSYDIFGYGVYEFKNLVKNILGKTVSGHFLFDENGVEFIESERIVITRDYFGVHREKEYVSGKTSIQ